MYLLHFWGLYYFYVRQRGERLTIILAMILKDINQHLIDETKMDVIDVRNNYKLSTFSNGMFTIYSKDNYKFIDDYGSTQWMSRETLNKNFMMWDDIINIGALQKLLGFTMAKKQGRNYSI